MLCPLDVMGQLVALQGDHSLLIRREALRLVQLEDEKHPTFLDNRLLEGVELTYAFQVQASVLLNHLLIIPSPSLLLPLPHPIIYLFYLSYPFELYYHTFYIPPGCILFFYPPFFRCF